MSFFRKASEATYTEPEMHTPPPMYKIVAAVSPSGFCGYNLMKLCEEFIPVFGGGLRSTTTTRGWRLMRTARSLSRRGLI